MIEDTYYRSRYSAVVFDDFRGIYCAVRTFFTRSEHERDGRGETVQIL